MLSEKHLGLRYGLELKKPKAATDSPYLDYEKIIIELYDGVAKLERVARLSKMLFSNSAPHDIWKQLEEALKDAEPLLEKS